MPISHKPTHDYLIGIKRPRPELQNMPLIHGVHRAMERPPHDYADIIAVGPGRPNATGLIPTPPARVGDCVMVRDVAGDPETIDGVVYHWFIPDEILAVVEQKAVSLVAS